MFHDIKLYLIIQFVIISAILVQKTCLSQQMVHASWDDTNSDSKLLHLTINENTGQVYVGAVNNIYQLSSDLKLLAQAVMGPALDDYKCPVTRQCPSAEKKLSDYHNKALVIFDQNLYQSHHYPSSTPKLISCGTLFQGSCALHNLDNITQFDYQTGESVVANSPNASTVAFIAPGPVKQSPVLYIGSSYTGLGYNEDVPTVSSRSLDPDTLFAFASSHLASGTRLIINSLSRDRFPIVYIYGFSSHGFSYFITVQRQSTTSSKPFITKLVRICQKDVNYHSYVEVLLTCRSNGNGIDYNLAQAAYVGKPGANLAREMGISMNDEVLFVTFSKSKDENDIYNEPSQNSAVCIYTLQFIQKMFTANIEQCFRGNGQQGLDFISFTTPCESNQMPITDDFCGTDVNSLINGLLAIETSPIITYNNTLLTAIAANPSFDYTVVYVGTSNGRLKRLVVESERSAKEYFESSVDLSRKTPINPDLKFDRKDGPPSFIYAMNDRRVSLIKVQECWVHKTCSDCLAAQDPHCGWCSTDNKCTVKNACQSHQDGFFWLSYQNKRCPNNLEYGSTLNTTPLSMDVPSAFTIRITSIAPSKGPMSGGTNLVLWVSDFQENIKANIFIGEYQCHVTARRKDKIECTTGKAERPGSLFVSLKHENYVYSFIDYAFLYVEDPRIELVTSSRNYNAYLTRNSLQAPPPKGIPAGGIRIHVKGKNLNCVQEPLFYVVLEDMRFNGTCLKESEDYINCLSPHVPEEKFGVFRILPEEPMELDYGFIMDNVATVHNLATRSENRMPMFLMYPNPVYKPFQEDTTYIGDYLVINGTNLNLASTEHDIRVNIGSSICDITLLNETQLTCRPLSQPAALVRDSIYGRRQLPEVKVTVGNSLNFTIGKISYENQMSLENIISRQLLYIVFVGASFLIFIVIAILIAYKRKANESTRVVKTMQEQMDVLEMKVASEAKQAFTELQTEMTDLTDDIEHGGIPYLDYRIYAMKVLFPNEDDHPVLNAMKIDPSIRDNFEKGIASFGQLIYNKTFLLLFIRTLESNRYFSMKDRVNVASLIIVTLQGKMEYCTDILKTLLAELIEKSMESKSHPKLLLRRTESVAERMLSSWFTFLLYKFLRECAGEPLFLLYQAIKHQVNKGPVDALTSEARCSLSEEKLIRQSVDYKNLLVYVSICPQTAYLSGIDPNIQNDKIEIPLKVLDCDTISQVKDKAIDALYKSTPYSQRPHRDNLDLEWRENQTLKALMADDDHTTKADNYWRRLNTLAHYKVSDNASLMLVMKQNSMHAMSMIGKNEKNCYETLNFSFVKPNSPIMNGLDSPLNEQLNNGCKYWHLVRHHNNDYADGERSAKMVSEIYLTRLLATKGTLQRFVDDLFETIFSTARLTSSLPIAIKYMFDFLDDQARSHGKFILNLSSVVF